MLATILLGIGGAVVGGWLSSVLFGMNISDFSIGGFVVAVIGALLLLFLYRVFLSAKGKL
jgi:uncharacterized membrane protein YeaQ/YmgE (transglycosylase-associated protein family)